MVDVGGRGRVFGGVEVLQVKTFSLREGDVAGSVDGWRDS